MIINGTNNNEIIESSWKLIIIELKSNLIKNDVNREVIITIVSTIIKIEILLDLDKLFINLFIYKYYYINSFFNKLEKIIDWKN